MKNLKIKATSAALLLTLFTLSVSAQPQGRKAPQKGQKASAEKMAEISTDRLDQRLELTDAQESDIYAINLKYAQEREAKRAERPKRPAKGEEKAERPDREAIKSAMQESKECRKAHMIEIMQVLSDEQKIDYAMMLANSKAHKAPQRGRKAAEQRGVKKSPRRAQQSRS